MKVMGNNRARHQEAERLPPIVVRRSFAPNSAAVLEALLTLLTTSRPERARGALDQALARLTGEGRYGQ